MSKFIFILFTMPALCYASFDSGRYTAFDRYGLTPSPDSTDPAAKAYAEFQKHALKGGTFRSAVSETMDLIWPDFYQKGLQKQVYPWAQDFIYETLMQYVPEGEMRTLHPVLAAALGVDVPSRTYVIELRKGVTFSDGSPMSASDVLFSWKWCLSEVNGPALQPWFDRVFGKNPEVKMISDYEIQVRFPEIPDQRQREAIWNFLNAFRVVKPNKVQNDKIQIPNEMIGTGPYQVTSASRDKVVLERRKDHWNQASPSFNFDVIEISLYRDLSVAREALKKHDLDFYNEFNFQTETIFDSFMTPSSFFRKNEIQIVDEDLNALALHMNVARAPLNDIALRKALVLANDVEPGNRMYFSGKLSVIPTPGANSPLSPKGPAAPEVAEKLKGDSQYEEAIKPFEEMGLAGLVRTSDIRTRLREASRLLTDAGYKTVNGVLTKEGKPIKIDVLIWTESRMLKLVEDLRGNLKRLGIELNFKPIRDTAEMLVQINKLDYDLFPQPIPIPRKFSVLDPDLLQQKFSSDYAKSVHPQVDPNNYANFVSPTLDRLLNEISDADPATAGYKTDIDAFLRLISANTFFLMMGERTKGVYYADKHLCFPPVTRGNSDRIIPTVYYSDQCPSL
jgi:ABC-type transport system substrate-binding protein